MPSQYIESQHDAVPGYLPTSSQDDGGESGHESNDTTSAWSATPMSAALSTLASGGSRVPPQAVNKMRRNRFTMPRQKRVAATPMGSPPLALHGGAPSELLNAATLNQLPSWSRIVVRSM